MKNPRASFAVGTELIPEYAQSRQQGGSVAASATKAGAMAALRYSHPIAMTAFDLAPLAYEGIKGAYSFRKQRYGQIRSDHNSIHQVAIGGGYVDTQQAQTMRQAALQQIQGNKMNARSALGGEARIFSPFAARNV